MPKPAIIVHGGAGTIQPYIWSRFLRQTNKAARTAQELLDSGATALDAAIAATVFMEDDVTFNAGTGAALNRVGQVECDAFVMTNERRSGAVTGVTRIKNPVLLARMVLEHTPHELISGAGAEALAKLHGMPLVEPASLISQRRKLRYKQLLAERAEFDYNPEHEGVDASLDDLRGADEGPSDTVGACVLDAAGGLAVASSTGGIMMKWPGRVGDTPLSGCGSYCGPAGAVSCTGHGEAAIRICMAKYCYDMMERGTRIDDAAKATVDYLVATVNGHVGLIAIDRYGNRAWYTSTMHIAIGLPDALPDSVSGYYPASD